MNLVHFLPTLAKSGFGVSSIVQELSSYQSISNNVQIRTLDSPSSIAPFHADVCHQHMIWLRHGFYASQYSSSNNIPLIISPHGALHPWALKQSYFKKRIAWSVYQRRLLESADCLQATSLDETIFFRELGLKSPISLIPNGINCSLYPKPSANNRNSFDFTSSVETSSKKILFMSRLVPQKGIELLLDSFAALRDIYGDSHHCSLVVAGSGSAKYERMLRRKCDELAITPFVQFVGQCYGQNKLSLFGSVDFFFLPSLAEGFPMVVLEAMASSLPVIVSTSASWTCLERYKAGWSFTPDTEGILSSLLRIVETPRSEAVVMGANARHLVSTQYSIDKVCRSLRDLYLWLSGESSHPPNSIVR